MQVGSRLYPNVRKLLKRLDVFYMTGDNSLHEIGKVNKVGKWMLHKLTDIQMYRHLDKRRRVFSLNCYWKINGCDMKIK